METTHELPNRPNRYIGGAVLIGVGAVILLAQFIDLGIFTLYMLSAIFVLAGVASREAGWFIPGGIIGGLAQGAFLTDSNLLPVSEQAEGGIFLLIFALGWVSIYLLTKLFTNRPQHWALIPGGIMALIGGAVLLGEAGERALTLFFTLFNYVWPVALIALGLHLLRRGK